MGQGCWRRLLPGRSARQPEGRAEGGRRIMEYGPMAAKAENVQIHKGNVLDL